MHKLLGRFLPDDQLISTHQAVKASRRVSTNNPLIPNFSIQRRVSYSHCARIVDPRGTSAGREHEPPWMNPSSPRCTQCIRCLYPLQPLWARVKCSCTQLYKSWYWWSGVQWTQECTWRICSPCPAPWAVCLQHWRSSIQRSATWTMNLLPMSRRLNRES